MRNWRFICKRKKNIFNSFLSLCMACVLLFLQTQAVCAENFTDKDVVSGDHTQDGLGIGVLRDSTVVITMDAKTASSGITWATMGFYITKHPKATANEVSTAKTNPDAVIWLSADNGHRVSGERRNKPDLKTGRTVTTVTIPYAKWKAAMEASGCDPDWVNGKAKVYFQGVLAFYRGGRYYSGEYYTWDETHNASVAQGKPHGYSALYPSYCENDWKQRYGKEVEISTRSTDNIMVNWFYKNGPKDGKSTTWSRCLVRSVKNDMEQWTSVETSYPDINCGNGLGFSTSTYYPKDKVKIRKEATPAQLKDVKASQKDSEQYYLYKICWSRYYENGDGQIVIDEKTGTRKQRGTVTYTGSILGSNGKKTQNYIEWVSNYVRGREFTVPDDKYGLVINVFYKKPSMPSEEDSEDDGCATAVIQSSNRGPDTRLDNEQYDSVNGIPSSDSQYVNVFAKDYLFKFRYHPVTQTTSYTYHSGCWYEEPWSVTDDKGNVVASGGGYWHHGTASTTRSYTYYKYDVLGVWKIDHATVTNDSLTNAKMVRLDPSDYNIQVEHAACGRVLRTPPETQGTAACGGAGEPGDYRVRNDKVILTVDVQGVHKRFVAMDHREVAGNHVAAPAPSGIPAGVMFADGGYGNNVLFKQNIEIPFDLANDTYDSTGSVTYRSVVNIGAGDALREVELAEVNEVTVHTPTVTYPSTPVDAKAYCQLVDVSDTVNQLVLDRDFWVYNSSSGYHTSKRGYGEREYLRYIAKKEVKFPFDVYGCSSGGTLGTYYPADTWIDLNLLSGKGQFYLPIWVVEGDYEIEFRSRTINCAKYLADNGYTENELDYIMEHTANTELSNYVSYQTLPVTVSGRLFGLSMYDHSDYPAWGEYVFRMPKSLQRSGLVYTVGAKDRNGKVFRAPSQQKYTFTLVNGSHPFLANQGVLKPGYVQRFYVTTFGTMYNQADHLTIEPTFWFAPADGSTPFPVDLYYDETIGGKLERFVKVGSERDRKNIKKSSLGNAYTSVPAEELQDKARLTGTPLKQILAEDGCTYGYTKIDIPQSACTYVGKRYVPVNASSVLSAEEYAIAEKSAQKWYFVYSLPANVHAVRKGREIDIRGRSYTVDEYASVYGVDYHEAFWETNGEILVNWDVVSVSGAYAPVVGNGGGFLVNLGQEVPHLSYLNRGNAARGYCNMWRLEGYQYSKVDNSGRTYQFADGDVLLYRVSDAGTVATDYTSRGTH